MDIVIPYKHSRWSGTELKYALRSACMHLSGGVKQVTSFRPVSFTTGYDGGASMAFDRANVQMAYNGNIFIIGDNPKLPNTIHIPHPNADNAAYKEKNIFNKLMVACNDERVSDEFIYLNDDHFLLTGFDISKYYATEWGPRRTDLYQQTVDNTLAGISPEFNFDVHCPMIINKGTFMYGPAKYDWGVKGGYCMKTLYAYWASAEPTPTTDLKLSNDLATYEELKAKIEGRAFWSINENMRSEAVLRLLNEYYPNKTIYE